MSLTICTSEKLMMCNDADAVYPLKNQGSRGSALLLRVVAAVAITTVVVVATSAAVDACGGGRNHLQRVNQLTKRCLVIVAVVV